MTSNNVLKRPPKKANWILVKVFTSLGCKHAFSYQEALLLPRGYADVVRGLLPFLAPSFGACKEDAGRIFLQTCVNLNAGEKANEWCSCEAAEPSSGHRIFNDFLEIDCVESLLGNPLIAIKNSKRLFLPWGRKRR